MNHHPSTRTQVAPSDETLLKDTLKASRTILRVAPAILFRTSATLLAAMALVGFNPQALASTETWSSSNTSVNFSSTTNWGGNPPPGATSGFTSTDLAVFNSAVGTVGTGINPIIIDQATQNIGGITFTGAAGSFTIGTTTGNSLFLTSGGTIQATALTGTAVTETVNAPLVIESGTTTPSTYTITNAATSGTGAGSGTLIIGGPITAGTGSYLLTINGANTNYNTISGNISNGLATTFGITKNGAGTWLLTGSNSYIGTTTVTGGVLDFGAENALYGDATANWNGSNLFVQNGGTLALQVGASGPLFTSSDITTLLANMATTSSGTTGFENGSLLGFDTVNSGGSFTYSGVIANPLTGGTMGINKLGAGTLILAGANTYSGTTLITSGTVQADIASVAGVSGALGLNSAVSLANSANAALNITGFNTQIGSLTGGGTTGGNVILGSNTLTLGGDNTSPAAYAGTISGAGGSLVKIGLGAETLSGTNTYTGTTTISTGALDFLSTSALYNGTSASWNGTNIIVGSGGTLGIGLGVGAPYFTPAQFASLLAAMDATSTTTSGFENGSAIGIDTTGIASTYAYNIPITNAAAGLSTGFSKLGTGTLLLTASNTYTGPTEVYKGTLEFANEAALYDDNTADWTASNIIVGNGGTLALDVGDSAPLLTGSDLALLLANLNASTTGTTGFEAGSTLAINTTPSVSGTVTYSGTLANAFGGGAVGLTKLGSGTLKLNGSSANTYTGPTTVNAGTLLLDFHNFATPTNLINPASALNLGGGTLVVSGTANGAPSQAFASTTLTQGPSTVSGSGGGTISLGAITYNVGSILQINGAAYNNAPTTTAGQAGTGLVPSLSTITTTSGASNGLLISGATGAAAFIDYATVGLYDFAITTGAGPNFVIAGASQGTGGTAGDGAYVIDSAANLTAGTVLTDIIGTAGTHNTTSVDAIRFNAPGVGGLTISSVTSAEAVLVTPNVGANNILISGNNSFEPGQRSTASAGSMAIIQNNTLGFLNITEALSDGKTAGSTFVQSGAGTVDYTGPNSWTGQTYLDGGIAEIAGDTSLGSVTTPAAVDLNGGELLGSATFSLDNNGVTPRPITLLNDGGGIAAVTGSILTVDGVIGSTAAGTGPLIIGIPASAANSNTLGLVPGTGAGTANTTQVFGDGTVKLTGGNFYSGGTTLVSGTLNINGINALGGLNYGGVTFNGGALQYATTINNGSTDLTSIGSAGVTIASGGGTIDTAGDVVSFAGSIGNHGSGGLTVLSSNPGGSLSLNGGTTFTGPLALLSGSLTLSGNNAYTGATSVTGGTLTLTSGATLSNTAITVARTAVFDLTGNTIGTTGATISLNGGATISLQDNAIDDVTLNATPGAGSATVFTVGSGGSAANLDFDLNNLTADELIINDGVTAFGSSGGKIFVDDLNNLSPSQLTYTLISDPDGGIASGSGLGAYFSMGNTTLLISGTSYSLSLQSTPTTLQLLLTPASVNYYWTGNTSSSWSAISNFATDHTGATPQTSNLSASSNVFLTADSPNGANTASQTLDGNYTINSLSFTGAGTGAASTQITLASGTGTSLTIEASNGFADAGGNSYAAGTGLVVQPGSAAHTISANIGLGAKQTWQINNSPANFLTVSGVIADAQGTALDSLTVAGSGELVLAGANTYDGGTIVSGGTLMLAPTGSLLATGALTVTGSGTFDLGANSQTIGALSDGGTSKGTITASTGPAVLTIANSANSTFSGTITDNNANNSSASLGLTLQGSANVILSGSNSFTAGVNLVSGNLTAANNYALGSPTSQNTNAGLTFNNAGVSNAYFTSSNPQLAALNTGASYTGTGNVILGNIAGGGSATTLHIGLNGGNDVFGGVIADQTGVSTNAIGNIEIDAGGFLQLNNADTFTGTTVVSGSGAAGPSELMINSALALQDSTLNYNNQGGLFVFGSVTAATLAGLTGSENLALSNSSLAAVDLTIGNNNVSSIYTGNLSGLGSVDKIGTGTVQIGSGASGGASYAGTTTVDDGTLIIGGTGALTSGGLTVSGLDGTSTLIIQDNAVVNTTGAFDLDIGGGIGYPANAIVTITGSANVTVSGFAFGNGAGRVPTGVSLTISQNGTLIDNGTFDMINSDGGTITVGGTVLNLNGGLLAVQNFIETNVSNTNTTTKINFNGGTLEALASDPSGSTFLPALTQSSASVLAGGAIIDPNGFNITVAMSLASGVANDGGLTLTGSGTLTLSGSNSYVGPTRINGGELIISNSNAITASSALTFGGGALQLNSTTDYSSKILNSTGPVKIDLNGQTAIFSGGIGSSNTGGLTLEDAVPGTGSLTLTGASSYSGATMIDSGATLILGAGGSLPNPNVTVDGVLKALTGNGGIAAGAGTVTLAGGSTLTTVDGAIGALTINGGVTFGGATAANLDFDINTDAGTADTLTITGPVTYGAAGGSITLTDIGQTTLPASGSKLTLITDASGLGAEDFSLTQASLLIDGQTYVLSLSNSTADSEIVTFTLTSLGYYWTGQTSSSWSAISNFSTAATGGTTRVGSLSFVGNVFLTADTASNLTQTLDGNYTINSLSFTGTGTTAGSAPVTLSNGTGTALTLDPTGGFSDQNGTTYAPGVGLVVQPGAASDMLAANVNLKVSQTWDVNNSPSNPLIVTGVIADGTTLDSLTKTGTGTMILDTAETYDGGTIINQGTLALGLANALLTTAPVTVSGTGTLDLAGNNQTLTALADGGSSTGAITSSTGSATLTFNNTAPITFRGALNDNNSVNGSTLAVLLEGTSNVTLSGSGNFTGGTNLTSGNLTVSNNYGLGNPASTNLAAGLQMNPALGSTVTAYFTSSNPNIAALDNPGLGTSNVVLGGTASGGTSTTLNIGPGDGGTSTFTGTISDQTAIAAGAAGGITVYGGATLVLDGTNTFTGVTTISGTASQLVLTSAQTIENSIYNTNGGGILNTGTYTAITLGGLTGSQNLALTNAGSPLTITFGNALVNNDVSVFTGNLSGLGGIVMNSGTAASLTIGSGTTGGASYTGSTIVNGGTLILGGTTNLTGPIDLTAAPVTAGGVGIANGLVVQDQAVINTGTNPLNISSNDPPNSGNNYAGPSNFTVAGNAVVTVPSFSLGNNSRVETGAGVTISGSGQLIVNGNFALLATEGGTASTTNINLNGGTLLVDSFSLGQGTNGAAQLVNFNFNGGVLKAGASDLNPTNSVPEVFMSANTATNLINTGTNAIEGGLTVKVLTGGAFINTNGFNITIGQPIISGTSTDGGLTKLGAGNLTLSSSDSYVGPTNVDAGRLIISGSVGGITSSSAVNIAAGATLEVDSNVNNAVTIQVAGRLSGAGGTIGPANVATTGTFAPGFSVATPAAPGILTAKGNVTLANGAVFSIQLGVATQTDSDSLTMANSSTLTLNDATLRLTDGTAFNPASEPTNFVYVLVNGGASATGSGTDVFGNATTSGSIVTDALGDSFAVYYGRNAANTATGADIDLVSIAPVPEPGTWAELIAGIAMLCIWRRSRRKAL